MNPHRPRKPRKDRAALYLLDSWRRRVERHERALFAPVGEAWSCPCDSCSGLLAYDRERLESLMHNGGRRAHKLRAAVTALDGWYRAVTVEKGAWKSLPWWDRREPL